MLITDSDLHDTLTASRVNSLPDSSRTAAHVNPAEVVPDPDVSTDRGQSATANLRN